MEGFANKQGKNLLSFRKNFNNSGVIEGFEDNGKYEELWNKENVLRDSVDDVIKRDMNELKNLEQTFMQVLSDYTTSYKLYMTDVADLLNAETSGYVGKNIRTNDGIISYINDLGIARSYNNETYEKRHSTCGTGEPISVNAANVQSLNFSKGSPMRAGEPCGFAGKNIYIGPDNIMPTYVGCYKDTPTRAMPEYIGVMTFQEAVRKTHELGYKYFGLQDAMAFGNNKSQVFVSNSDDYGKYGAQSCTSTLKTGEITGQQWQNAVYAMPSASEYGQLGYVDKNNVLRSYGGLTYNNLVPGCPTENYAVDHDIFNAFQKGDNMTRDSICEGGIMTSGLKNKVEELNRQLIEITQLMNSKIEETKEKIKNLKQYNSNEQDYLNEQLNQYQNLYQKYNNLDKKGYASLDAMYEDAQLIETNSLYKYIMWLLISISVVYFTFRHIK